MNGIDIFKTMTPEQLADMAYMRGPNVNPTAIGKALAQASVPMQAGAGQFPTVGSLGAAQPPAFKGLGGQPAPPPMTGTATMPQVQAPPPPGGGAYAQMLPYMLNAMGGSMGPQKLQGTMGTPMLGSAPKAPVKTPVVTPRADKMSSIGKLMTGG